MDRKLFAILLSVAFIFSCEKPPQEIPVSSVTINQPAAEMVVGETVQLSANVLPSNATDKTLTWASSKQSVATVSRDGLVTAIAEGSSTITVTAGDKSASCKVTVEKKVVPVSSVSLNMTELSLEEGEESSLVATVKPNDADDKTVTWKSSDATIVSVNSEGKVSALKAGTATITASAGDKSASCKVTVEKKVVPVTSVTLNKTVLTLVEGGEDTLVATVKPDDATDQAVTWKSSDETVATVKDGKVIAKKEGTATVIASAGDKSASCTVTVEKKVVPVTSVTLDKTELTLVEGNEETLVATVKPDDATDRNVTWKSSDETVTTVKDGKVTAKKEGMATVTATAGDKSASCKVTVEKTASNNIVFADNNIKAKLVSAFDVNGDGEISYEEAAAVTSIDGVFGAIKTYKSFEEFKYFTSIMSIPSRLFMDWNLLTKITLPKGVTYIGDNAFRNCLNLSDINIPFEVTAIGSGAFSGCSRLNHVDIPSSVKSIGESSFWGCSSLTSITIPMGVKSIESHTFVDCDNLISISIPETITRIGESAFSGCSKLSQITIPEGVESIGSYAFYGCSSLKSVRIPEKVSDILSHTFEDCSNLTSVIIPDSVSSIGLSAFENCSSLQSITVPTSVTYIANRVFMGCTSLRSVVLPDNNYRFIGNYVFSGCICLKSVNIPNGLTEIPPGLFYNCSSLTSIIIPEGVTCIQGESFRGCSGLESISIPNSVMTIETAAFRDCSKLVSISMPQGLTVICDGVFQGCDALSHIILPEGVTSIGSHAFYGCGTLLSLSVPEGVTTIGINAFNGCSSLDSITIKPSSPASLGRDSFKNTTCSIYVPSKSLTEYKTSGRWVEYSSRIRAIPE